MNEKENKAILENQLKMYKNTLNEMIDNDASLDKVTQICKELIDTRDKINCDENKEEMNGNEKLNYECKSTYHKESLNDKITTMCSECNSILIENGFSSITIERDEKDRFYSFNYTIKGNVKFDSLL